ncbi:MAG: DUF1570 domain-containing protein [Planctomycetia bacterium]|nr:DUF1570 domain-containing protein [Planctomycetia bacterium]
MHRLLILLTLLVSLPAAAHGKEYVTFKHDGVQARVAGQVVVEASDGGLMLLDEQGMLWTIQKAEQISRSKDELPLRRLTAKELGEAVLKELPPGFSVRTTAHYVICYNTSQNYAEWCGGLLERLHRAFTNFWGHKGFEIKEPPGPMVVLVFADKASYRRYAINELGDAVDSIIAYYNLKTNRIAMYDLTGVQAERGDAPRRSGVEINATLNKPEAANLVATIVHEATHQIAFNCGVQTRLADVPVWLSEGMAMYFETPDLSGSRAWRGVGAVNRARLDQFRRYSRTRPADSLSTLLSDDHRLQKPDGVLDAYAESWALTYYLIKQHPKDFVAYLKLLADKSPGSKDTPEQRRQQFEQQFGDLKRLDEDFQRQTGRLH